jgi:Tol biopolymer transport system component
MVLPIRDDNASQLWMIDLERGTQSRLTFDDLQYSACIWFADGSHLIACGGPMGSPAGFELIRMSAEGTSAPVVLGKGLFPELTPDQTTVLFSFFSEANGMDIGAIDLAGLDSSGAGKVPARRTVVGGPQWQYAPRLSPDGALLAYVSRETGRDEVYLRRYPEGDKKRQISAEGGGWPMWNAAGDRLFYMSGLDLIEVEITPEPNLRVGAPLTLFTRPRGEDIFNVGWPLYFQVDGAGEYFYMLNEVGLDQGNRPLAFIQNWVEEFPGD